MSDDVQVKIKDNRRINRFIFFYILRELWKQNNRKMPDLYRALFGDEENETRYNRTLYDKIMRLERIGDALSKRQDHLFDVTGIYREYILGDEPLPNPVSRDKWIRFIELRLSWKQDKVRRKPDEIKEAETEIKELIRNSSELKKLTEFQEVRYFAIYGHKRNNTFDDSLANVEMMIKKCSYNTMDHISFESLSRHRDVVAEYLRRVQAVLTLKLWEQEKTSKIEKAKFCLNFYYRERL